MNKLEKLSEENYSPDISILIQAKLLELYPEEEHVVLVEKYSAKIRDHMEKHPEIINSFKENPKETILELKKRFYH